MLAAHTSCFLAAPSSFAPPPPFFSLIFLLSRMRPISGTLSRFRSDAIDQPVLYHDAMCAHTLYRRCRIMAIRQRGFASINCHSNQRRSCLGQDDYLWWERGGGRKEEYLRRLCYRYVKVRTKESLVFYFFRINDGSELRFINITRIIIFIIVNRAKYSQLTINCIFSQSYYSSEFMHILFAIIKFS